MIPMLLLAILQSAPVQEKTIEAFLKGDDAARAELVRLGAIAIQPLQKARDKDPKKIDALVYELKKGAAYPKDSAGPDRLETKAEFRIRNMSFRDALALLREECRFTLIYDRFEPSDLKAEKVTVEKGGNALDVLREICLQTGLDFGFFHNTVVLAKPERLWPAAKSAGAFGPPAAERQRLTPDDEKLLKHLRSMKASVDFQDASLSDLLSYVGEFSGLAFEIPDEPGKSKLTIRGVDQKLFDWLCLVTQCRDLDFMIRDGKVAIDTREAIEKSLPNSKR